MQDDIGKMIANRVQPPKVIIKGIRDPEERHPMEY
jgi:hypothetical protein